MFHVKGGNIREVLSESQINKLLADCSYKNRKTYEEEIIDRVNKSSDFSTNEIETLKQIDKYFTGGISVEDKKYLIELSKDLSITISEAINMCVTFANEIDYIKEFREIRTEITDFIRNKGKFPQEYWDKRKEDPYDWLRCITPRKALEDKYYLSTVSYYGWEHLKKFDNTEPKSKLDSICKNIALFAKNEVSEKYLEGKTILNEIIERIQATENYDFEAIILTTVSHNGLHIFDIFASDLVNQIKEIVESQTKQIIKE